MFHVSFLCFNSLIINTSEGWNIEPLCFIFAFNVSFSKTLWEKNKNTVGAIQKHCGSDNALHQCFEKWNMKLNMKHKSSMFHFLKWLIFNYFITKNETWKIKQMFWIRMDICKRIRDASIYTSKKISLKFYSWAIFFCFHLSGSNSRYLLSGVLGGSTAALFITSDIYSKKLIPCSLHEHASE